MKKIRQRVMAAVLTGILAHQIMPQIAYGSTSRNYGMDIEKLLNSLNEVSSKSLPTKELNKTKLMSDNIDLDSDESVDVIVQFNAEPLLKENSSTYSLNSGVKEEQESFKKRLKSVRGIESESIKINYEYQNAINAFAMTLPSNQIERIMEFPEVKRIWVDSEFSVKPIEEIEEDTNYSKLNGEVTKESTGFLEESIEELHKKGIDGNGIKVGILDTGIDYNHPDLIDHFKGRDYIGYDFIDNDNDPMETTIEDWKNTTDPETEGDSTYYTFHGTHVAGILAGKGDNDVEYAVTGVAPNAELYAYRVLGPYGNGPTSSIIKAVDQAIKDDLDVINLSLSSAGGNPTDPLSIALNNASIAGVTPVLAAGNSGTRQDLERAMYTLGTPSVAALPITVGAGTFDSYITSLSITVNNKVMNGKLSARDFGKEYTELKGKEFEIVANEYGSGWDFEDIDVKGKVSLIMTGVVGVEEIIKNAKTAGAEAIILYNPSGEITENIGEVNGTIPVLSISAEDGVFIKDAISSGNGIIKFGKEKNCYVEGGDLADFSSKGPVFDTFDIKPDIIARGVNMFSTYPEFVTHMEDGVDYSTAYRRASGTSMAAPYVAGVAALLLQQNDDYKPEDVKTAIMNRGDRIEGDYSVFEVGAGMVDTEEALSAKVLFKVEDQTYNDIEEKEDKISHLTGALRFGNFKDSESGYFAKDLIIDNNTSFKKTYNTSWEFLPVGPGSQWIGTVDGETNNISFDIPEKIHVYGNQEKTIEIKPIIPENAEEGIYEGYLTFTNIHNKKDVVKIPFAMRYTRSDMDFDIEENVFSTKLDEFNTDEFLKYNMTLNKELDYADIILMDEKGEKALGYFYRMDNMKGYPLGMSFSGAVVPAECSKLIGDSDNPVSNETFVVPEGKYKIGVVYVDNNGESNIIHDDIVIDNSKPKVTTNQNNGITFLTEDSFVVEEYKGEEVEAYWIKGNIHHKLIDDLKSIGYENISQANNSVGIYSQGQLIKSAEINENGDFKIPITRDDLMKGTTFSLLAYGYNKAGIKVLDNISFVDKEKQAFFGKFSSDKLNKGDTVEVNISAANLIDTKEVVLLPLFENIELIDIRASKELTEYAKVNNLTIDIEERGDYVKEYALTLKDEKGEIQEIKVDELLDISVNINSSDMSSDFYIDVQTMNSTGDTVVGSVLVDKYPEVIFNDFDLRLDIFLGALDRLDNTQYIEDDKKTEVYIIDENNNKIYPEGPEFVTYAFKGLEPMEKATLVINVPGHININKEIMLLEKDSEGNLIVKNREMSLSLLGGDINNDDIIDMRDTIAIKENMGKVGKSMAEDLDGNGIIDGYDLAIAVKNYLSVGDHIDEKPIEKVNGKKLEDILNEAQKLGRFMGVDPHKKVYSKGEEISIKFKLFDIYSDYTSTSQNVQVGQYDENDNLIHEETFSIQANEGPGSGVITITPKEETKTVRYFMIDEREGVGAIEPTVKVTIEEAADNK